MVSTITEPFAKQQRLKSIDALSMGKTGRNMNDDWMHDENLIHFIL
jgi:hypothetical protein